MLESKSEAIVHRERCVGRAEVHTKLETVEISTASSVTHPLLQILSNRVVELQFLINVFFNLLVIVLWQFRGREEREERVCGYGLLDDASLAGVCT